jgi:hypothetical protein
MDFIFRFTVDFFGQGNILCIVRSVICRCCGLYLVNDDGLQEHLRIWWTFA